MYSRTLQPWGLNANLLCFFAVKFMFISTGSATVLLRKILFRKILFRKILLRRLPLLMHLASV
jgi:hypothetical protein